MQFRGLMLSFDEVAGLRIRNAQMSYEKGHHRRWTAMSALHAETDHDPSKIQLVPNPPIRRGPVQIRVSHRVRPVDVMDIQLTPNTDDFVGDLVPEATVVFQRLPKTRAAHRSEPRVMQRPVRRGQVQLSPAAPATGADEGIPADELRWLRLIAR